MVQINETFIYHLDILYNMLIQIDFPEKYDKLLKIYQINNDFKTKADAIVDLATKKLEPERKVFAQETNETKSKNEALIEAPER